MRVKCKKCLPKEGIDIPTFNDSDKNHLWNLKKESSIKVVKHLIEDDKFSYRDAKYITTHINIEYGKCNRCNCTTLDVEYINCPKCKALNFNWNICDQK